MYKSMQVFILCALAIAARAWAGDEFDAEYLWSDGAPGAVGDAEKDQPRITVHPAPEGSATGAAVIVFPGGGYRVLAADHEGLQVANFLNDNGISAFVLRYRLLPDYQPSTSLIDAQRAIRYVRHNAERYKIDPARIGVLGFSAGGHLTTAVATAHFEGDENADDPIDRESARPDFVVPVYPVTSRDEFKYEMGDFASTAPLVTEHTPPAFLIHTHEDTVVDPKNSLVFYQALLDHGVPAELHIFQRGAHGLGLAPHDPNMGQWPRLLVDWIRRGGWLTDAETVPVRGTVLVDGAPLYWGAVTFVPDDEHARTGTAAIDRGKGGTFETTSANVLNEGTYRVHVYRIASDWSEPQLGRYSMPDADHWELPDPITVQKGMEPLEFNIETGK